MDNERNTKAIGWKSKRFDYSKNGCPVEFEDKAPQTVAECVGHPLRNIGDGCYIAKVKYEDR